MALEITWTDEAEKTFSDIVDYLEREWGPGSVTTFLDRTDEVLALIKESPELRQASKKGIYQILITRHTTLYYTIESGKLLLLGFWGNRQDPEKRKY